MINFKDNDALGRVLKVDTTTVTVKVNNEDHLRRARVNRLVMLESRPGERLVGLIRKVSRIQIPTQSGDVSEFVSAPQTENLVDVSLVGTHFARWEDKSNHFVRTMEIVPETDALCFPLEGGNLRNFMRGISASHAEKSGALHLGAYALDDTANAYLDGNRLFQRHAAIVGSTGAGKSHAVARIIEKAAELTNANIVLFDIHGEYSPLANYKHVGAYKIAGGDNVDQGISDGVLFSPFWLLDHDSLMSLFVEFSGTSAPNQRMTVKKFIVEAKEKFLREEWGGCLNINPTVDSPVPFRISQVTEKIVGAANSSDMRLRERIEAKNGDPRLRFMFHAGAETYEYDWLNKFVKVLTLGTDEHEKKTGIKVIDFSEVPSDILPLVVSTIAQVIFWVYRWVPLGEQRHPISIFCDEAHLYMPDTATSNVASVAFAKIAKEGRKYGVGLVVISQRPADVNRSVLSQCNNFIAMRLTNAEDQNVIRHLFPADVGEFASDLPVLETGEALVVGDASKLPTRVKIQLPEHMPEGGTVQFWDKWGDAGSKGTIEEAVNNWRKQTTHPDEKSDEE